MKKYILPLLLLASSFAFAQKMERLDIKEGIICYASESTERSFVPRRDVSTFSKAPFSLNSTTTTSQQPATFIVEYIGFSDEAKAAFQAAVDIWESILYSPVPIRLQANWRPLGTGVLGSAGAGTFYRNFPGAKKEDTWYPVALAEKMAGRDLNDVNEPDIVSNFNSDFNWYLGLDGNTDNQHDLITVVLHEIGHGLGFLGVHNVASDGAGTYDLQGFPVVYTAGIEDINGEKIIDFTNGSAALGSALTSGELFYNTPAVTENHGTRPKIFAPSTFSSGSSISHLDESTFRRGDINSLMSPQVGQNEVIHDPGPITLDIFGEMGWAYTAIEHVNRPNTDDFTTAESYTVTASINSDIGYQSDEVMLYYSLDGFASDTSIVQMTSTSNPDEFTAEIPSNKTQGQVYTYFFKVKDIRNREFSNPSLLLPDRYFSFQSDEDNTNPELRHTPPDFIKTDDIILNLEAVGIDFLPLTIELEYSINNGPNETQEFTLTNFDQSVYTAGLELSTLNLQEGDFIEYKLTATDASVNSNSTVFPATGMSRVEVESTLAPVTYYFNDFDDVITANNDFFSSSSFSVTEETNFTDGAIHSNHPYRNGTGPNNESSYTLVLKVPIILKETNARMTFDEIVLIEPGETTASFGDEEFYDFAVVEGSKDGGLTWAPLADGYDSRINGNWFARFNSDISENNSIALGEESLFRSKNIDMLANGNFAAGDEILVRFRIFADEETNGWGWAIDNLNFQQDREAPSVEHRHLEFLTSPRSFDIGANVRDNFEVDSVGVLILVNETEQDPIGMSLVSGNFYNANIDASTLNVNDVIKYRIAAFDKESPGVNAKYLPSETEFFELPIINFNAAQETYSNDFNAESNDFVGNFFSVTTPNGFTNGAIHSQHPYPLAFGPSRRSTFTYMLKTPIVVSSTLPFINFDQAVITDPTDFVAVDGSKDGGLTWFEMERYTSNTEPTLWAERYQSQGDGEASLLRNSSIILTDHPQLAVGDEFVLRFRLERASVNSGWGWVIDNLEIQTQVVAGLEDEAEVKFANIFPNPIINDVLQIQLENSSVRSVDYSIVGLNGEEQLAAQNLGLDNENKASINVSSLPSGMFILRLTKGNTTKVYKVLKLD